MIIARITSGENYDVSCNKRHMVRQYNISHSLRKGRYIVSDEPIQMEFPGADINASA